jgi:hypothetical protein
MWRGGDSAGVGSGKVILRLKKRIRRWKRRVHRLPVCIENREERVDELGDGELGALGRAVESFRQQPGGMR